MRASSLTRAQVRFLIDEVLRTEADLDAFCLDYFPETHKRCSSRMQRIEKVSLLLSVESNLQLIVDRLNERRSGCTSLPMQSTGISREVRFGWRSALGVLILGLSSLFLGGVIFGRGSRFVTSRAEERRQSPTAIREEAASNTSVGTFDYGATEQGLIAGAWHAGNDDEVLWQSDLNTFRSKWTELSAHHLRLVDLKVAASPGQPTQYTGLWRSGDGPHFLLIGIEREQFRQRWMALSRQNLRLVDLEVYSEDGLTKFAGVWRAGSDEQELLAGLDAAQFNSQWKLLSKRGLRLVDIEVYEEDGKIRFAGIFRAGDGDYDVLIGVDWESFLAQWRLHNARQHRIVDLEIHSQNGAVRYTAVWSGKAQSHALYVIPDKSRFESVWRTLYLQGHRLSRIESYAVPMESPPPWPVMKKAAHEAGASF